MTAGQHWITLQTQSLLIPRFTNTLSSARQNRKKTTLHVSTIIENVYKFVTSNNIPSAQVPSTPLLAPAATILTTSSLPRNSPSKVGHYLGYASEKLGVRDAHVYKEALAREGYGPDILPYVEDKALTECGLTPGDVIRLKRGAAEWWNSSDAKRARILEPTDKPQPALPTSTTEYGIRFEKKYLDGGSVSCFGSGVVEAK